MTKHAHSTVLERHTAVVTDPEREKLLSEIPHWLDSSTKCITEIGDTIVGLKSARALAKRDIHMARASIEKKLKALEAEAELQMTAMVQVEEETLMKAQKRLMEHKLKLETTGTNLQKNCVGAELRKHIEEAKSRLAETRQSIITSKRHHRPSTVEFILHEELLSFVNGERILGKTQIKSTKGIVIRSSGNFQTSKTLDHNKAKHPSKIPNKDVSYANLNGVPTPKGNTRANHHSGSLHADFDKVTSSEAANPVHADDFQTDPTEAKHTKLNVFRKTVRSGETPKTHAVHNDNFKKPLPGSNEVTPKQRSTSAYNRNETSTREAGNTRISTSAREDCRALPERDRHDVKPVMKLLNNTDYVSYEEQGPEQAIKKQKKEKRNVSYAEYDTIKEITLLMEDALMKNPYATFEDALLFPETQKMRTGSGSSKSSTSVSVERDITSASEKLKLQTFRSRPASDTSISTVSYKSSSTYARGQKHTQLSDTWQAKIYSGSRESSPRSVSSKPSSGKVSGQRQVAPVGNLHTKSYSISSNASLSSISYKPPSAHSSGPKHVALPDTWQSSSFFSYTARFHTKKHPEDTDLCRLTGIVVLDNGQLVISDINHLRVMLFGPDYTYLSDIECPSPCGVCLVKNEIVAVTLFHNRKLLLLKVCMLHLERYKELHVNCPETLYAVRYNEGQFYVLCFAGHVHVMDDSGRQVRVLETGFGSGMARNLELDAKRKLVYITSLEHVTCFSHTGVICWQFTAKTSSKTFTPGGVVLHNDRLFVTDWGNHRVLELSLDGTFVRDVITDNLEFPHAMTVQHSTGSMFITQSNMFRQEARSRTVKVFSIK